MIRKILVILMFSSTIMFAQNYSQLHYVFSNSGFESNEIPSGGDYECFFILGEPIVNFELFGADYSGSLGFLGIIDSSVGISIGEIPTLKTNISQNYPNPFNPETTIKYSIKEDTRIFIEIYNIKGQKVKTLINEFREAGYHSVIWNGKDNNGKPVASGLYFYRMKTANYDAMRKMIMLK